MGWLCAQPESLAGISRGRRWLVFVVGITETMLWSGTIFGWASLVHVMKVQGVYGDLCSRALPRLALNTTAATTTPHHHINTTAATTTPHHDLTTTTPRGCTAQDEWFALLYTVACVVYSTPGVLVGYSLHHMGLAFTRVVGGLMVAGGFLLLGLTTSASPDYLWGATVLLSVGGNTVRMSSLQLANLFPQGRNTAMAIISGIFTPSAGVLMVLQTMFEGGLQWWWCCFIFAAASFMVVLVTPLVPRHHIPNTTCPHREENVTMEVTMSKGKEEEVESVASSVFSVSSFLHAYWLFINLFGVTLFSTHYNSWINKFSTSLDETSRYSRWFGWANILCVLVTPLPGLTMDLLGRRFRRGKGGVMARVATLQAMVVPMVVVSGTVLTQISMLLFRSPWAVYVGLAALMINRPSCLAVGNPFVRARYPADHFNRLVGIQGTALALLTFLQYPHFAWAQQRYYLTFGVTLAAILLGLSQPLHLLSKSYLTRVLSPRQPAVTRL